MKSAFFEAKPKRPRLVTDLIRREHGIVLQHNVPIRIHAENGGYLFSICSTSLGVFRYNDKRWGDKRKLGAKRVTWEQPV